MVPLFLSIASADGPPGFRPFDDPTLEVAGWDEARLAVRRGVDAALADSAAEPGDHRVELEELALAHHDALARRHLVRFDRAWSTGRYAEAAFELALLESWRSSRPWLRRELAERRRASLVLDGLAALRTFGPAGAIVFGSLVVAWLTDRWSRRAAPRARARRIAATYVAGLLTWDEAALDRAIGLAEGRPLRLQLVGRCVAERAAATGSVRVDVRLVDEIAPALERWWSAVRAGTDAWLPPDADAARDELARLTDENVALEAELGR